MHGRRLLHILKKNGTTITTTKDTFISSRVPYLHLSGLENLTDKKLETLSPIIAVSWTYDIENILKKQNGNSYLKYLLTQLDALVVDTKHYRNKVESFGIDPERVFVMPYGVDLEDFKFSNYKSNLLEPFKIYANRKWDINYGIQILLAAVREIINKKNVQLEICISGDGPHKTQMLDMFSEVFANVKIELPGFVSERKNRELLQKCDLYISPSPIDGTSVSMLESMAIGASVLTTNIQQNQEWIENEVTGYLFEVNSVTSLVNTINSIIEKRRDLGHVAKAARRMVEEKADYSLNVMMFQDFISNVIRN